MQAEDNGRWYSEQSTNPRALHLSDELAQDHTKVSHMQAEDNANKQGYMVTYSQRGRDAKAGILYSDWV